MMFADDLFPLEHKPLRPARSNTIGECVFASMWEATMTPTEEEQREDDLPFARVMRDFEAPVEQRHATAVASVVCWLGSNCGRSMLERAERESQAGHWGQFESYLIAWTLENKRLQATNSGVRTIEHCMTPAADFLPRPHLWRRDITQLPTLTAFDLESIEHLMLWLSDGDGQAFLARCRAEIARLNEERRIAEHAEWIRRRDANKAVVA